ncbi:MAG: ABC transporter ATP-binding protein [Candidatus Korarchaeota archaeon]|nr:ABC transporter ATP-binding protein [Candidatus Korarchaeota archaeon]
MKEEVVAAENLRKSYETYLRRGLFNRERKVVEALKGVSFRIYRGEVFGLLGPNGAGKTTTVKILSTLLLPDSGAATVLGYDVVKEAVEVRRRIGVSLTVEKGFFWKLTGRENLMYFGMLYGMDGAELRKRVQKMLELVGLEELGSSDKLYEEYSLGMKARLSIARALLTDPELLILDEPTLGLDPPSARLLRELLIKVAHQEGKTVLITTHNMFEAEIMCDRLAIINEGAIVAMDTVEGLKKLVSDEITLEMLVVLPAKVSIKQLREEISEAVSSRVEVDPTEEGTRIRVVMRSLEKEQATQEMLRRLHSMGCSVRRIEVKEPTLEDVFIELTGGN